MTLVGDYVVAPLRFVIDVILFLVRSIPKLLVLGVKLLPVVLFAWYVKYLYNRFEDRVKAQWRGYSSVQKVLFLVTFPATGTLALYRERGQDAGGDKGLTRRELTEAEKEEVEETRERVPTLEEQMVERALAKRDEEWREFIKGCVYGLPDAECVFTGEIRNRFTGDWMPVCKVGKRPSAVTEVRGVRRFVPLDLLLEELDLDEVDG